MHKKALTVAIAGALAAPMAAQAVDFTVSGQVNRAIVFTDQDTGDSVTENKDHGSSGTRVRFTGSSETMSGITAGINLELGINPSTHDKDPDTDDDADDVTLRHSAVSLGGEFGSLKLGHTSEAADGATYNDKSGVIGIGHGQESGASGAAKYVFGGAGGRNAGVHFSSAAFGPAALHLSASNDDRFSAKVTFSGDAGVASYGGALAYLDTGTGFETIGGGLGIKLSSGVTFSMAGESRSGSDESSFVQSTLGYAFGNNSVGVSWYGSSDVMGASGMGDGSALGIAFLHNMPKAGVDIMASVQQYSADVADDSMDMDDTVAIIGARVKF